MSGQGGSRLGDAAGAKAAEVEPKHCYSECSYPVLLAVINVAFSQVHSCWVPQMILSAFLFFLLGRAADLTVHLVQKEVAAIKYSNLGSSVVFSFVFTKAAIASSLSFLVLTVTKERV